MGFVYLLECQNCDYKYEAYLGAGRFYFDNNRLIKHIKQGRYGNELREVLAMIDNPYASMQNKLYVCKTCGKIEMLHCIKLYEKRGDYEKLIYTSENICENCSDKMEPMSIDKPIYCPCCKTNLKISVIGHWV